MRTCNRKGFPRIKGITGGISRVEYEYEIPFKDAREMLDYLCEHPLIEKMRYRIDHKGLTWEIDEFPGDNKGLVLPLKIPSRIGVCE